MMDLLNDETDEEIELVEISDAEGNRAEMRRLATVEYSGKLYHILGAVQEDETDDFSDDGLVLVRQDCTPDGADEYVITEDEREIEQVVGRAALRGAGVAGAKSDVAGGIFVKQRAVEQLAAAVDGAACRHQCHFANAAGAFVAVQQTAQQHLSLLGVVVHNPALLKGDTEVLDELAVEHIGLCAVDDALYPVLVGRSEHFLRGDVGQEHHALFALAGGAFPHSLIRMFFIMVRNYFWINLC